MSVPQLIFYSIIIPMGSWTVGLVVNAILMKQPFYPQLSNLNFIRSRKLNRAIGVDVVKWGAKNTFFRFFNPGLHLNNAAGLARLREVRLQMTYAEIGHLVGFIAVVVFAIFALWNGKVLFAGLLLLTNVFLNLHPALLQQENKRRIDRLISRFY